MSTDSSQPESYRCKRNAARRQLHQALSDLNYCLEMFGDELGRTQGWKNQLEGMEAIYYYLMQKHHWMPGQIRAMSYEDLRFALSEEMHGWKLPRTTP